MLLKWLSKPRCDHRWPASVRLSVISGHPHVCPRGPSDGCSVASSGCSFQRDFATLRLWQRAPLDAASGRRRAFSMEEHHFKIPNSRLREGHLHLSGLGRLP